MPSTSGPCGAVNAFSPGYTGHAEAYYATGARRMHRVGCIPSHFRRAERTRYFAKLKREPHAIQARAYARTRQTHARTRAFCACIRFNTLLNTPPVYATYLAHQPREISSSLSAVACSCLDELRGTVFTFWSEFLARGSRLHDRRIARVVCPRDVDSRRSNCRVIKMGLLAQEY